MQGVEKSRHGDRVGAMQLFKQVLHRNLDDANAAGHRCVARYRVNDTQGAIDDC
ncbi:MAG: hypothetical protein KME42_28800 [Tildeniella nuda ZEHNDER 1965/U140]|nr:hypothetical protein [Tildeniella nuda ZEHNDER 1965/U140]